MQETIKPETLMQVLRIIPFSIREQLKQAVINLSDIQEIVLRTNKPLCIYAQRGVRYLTCNGCLTSDLDSQPLVVVSFAEISECFNIACGYSVYSHISEIKEGYVTIRGGHRVGICGTAVVSSDEVMNIRDISTVSIRLCREVENCGESVVSQIRSSSGGVIICGVPCSGKTTVLRDVARILSLHDRRRVSLVDTRGELASVYRGEPQLNVGLSDTLSAYPRAQGIIQAVRVFSPEFILCDEIGSPKDASAILNGLNSGVRFLVTAHAGDYTELKSKPFIRDVLATGAFEKAIFLCGRDAPGVIKDVVNFKEKADE